MSGPLEAGRFLMLALPPAGAPSISFQKLMSEAQFIQILRDRWGPDRQYRPAFWEYQLLCRRAAPAPPAETAAGLRHAPMHYAPRAGMVSDVEPYRAEPRARWLVVWEEAGRMAETFWERVVADDRISKEFRLGVR